MLVLHHYQLPHSTINRVHTGVLCTSANSGCTVFAARFMDNDAIDAISKKAKLITTNHNTKKPQ